MQMHKNMSHKIKSFMFVALWSWLLLIAHGINPSFASCSERYSPVTGAI